MNVDGKHYRTIWLKEDDDRVVQIIDQRNLPHEFIIEDLGNVFAFARAIKDMHVRGAGLIGAAAGYGMYIASLEAEKNAKSIEEFNSFLELSGDFLKSTRPTAVNLAWAVNRQIKEISKGESIQEKIKIALETAQEIADEDAEFCKRLGEHGSKIIEEISKQKNGEVVNILTHCNAGWLAFVDYGSATAPIYEAHNKGIKVHVWVDETRPRNQGARLTAWELEKHGVPYTVIADNVGGHLMQHGKVDMVIVGTDRTTYTGDVANKIGTYLKALAAKDNGVPFYVALPSSTFDWEIKDGVKEIPIEQRGDIEVKYARGFYEGKIKEVLLTPENANSANYAFDVTPRRLITGLITERGICGANEEEVLKMFPEYKIQNSQDPKEQKKTGYVGVKFKTEMIDETIPENSYQLEKLKYWCKVFHDKNLAPPYEGGSYGNLSYRTGGNSFIITASSHSLEKSCSNDSFVSVDSVDFQNGIVCAKGSKKPSSEAMVHASIYNERKDIQAIFHGHSSEISLRAKELGIPETKKEEPYGTIELVNAILEILDYNSFIEMKNHGFISLGKTLDEAGNLALEYMRKCE
jgi:methylthioribose-1-phosphate isomerase